jgi:hypothetical protein
MNSDTLLLRQVHPSWIQQGRITSQVFQPTPKDKKRLSVYDGDKISPEQSWIHFAECLGYSSIGVMAVTVGECKEEGLSTQSDPDPFPEHIIIDFIDFSENQIKQKAKRLKAAAEKRSWLYQGKAI